MHASIILAAVLLALLVLTAGCADRVEAGPQRATVTAPAPEFVHVVFFDLKADTPDAAVAGLIEDAYRLLAKVPSVRRIESGRRDDRMARDVNDKGFTVGLVVYFDDKEGHDVYATHPLHEEYIARNKEHWAKVRVFDFTTSGGRPAT